MIEIYGFVPSWGLPDISPFVTKVVNYATMADIPFEYKIQPLDSLASKSPTAKLPYIVDEGSQVNDSTTIVHHLKKRFGDKLDSHLSASDHAVGLAFQRLVEENLYWSGVIYARWRNDEVFSVYLPSFVAPGEEPAPELVEAMGAYRQKIWGAASGHGMGLRADDDVLTNFKADIDALSDFLADKPFLLGSEPTSYDATVYSTYRHIADVPWDWAGRDYARSKSNLAGYATRMQDRFGV
ncbi:glutathione S-transferase family protein [Pseudonocardia sp. SID8383]|jgi:glutathione S-transferase|uniref:iIsoprene-epoxide--glutathione S-transferase n=1 Tax=Pseudonocardia sp. SID8383 TaxID=2690363 RepID=UPI0013702093|nr:glutathione S-transferase family protein [Pseudonocardia sp. SID8383]MYW71941.1 glutathione S-transferase family protein [Pseudonocardia sp. SID8383]